MAEEPEEAPGVVPGIMASRPQAELPEHMRAGLELTRQHTQVAGALSAMHWGKSMTPVMRRAVASYCERWGIDGNTELDVLGGSFYINSEYYLRKLGELRRAGVIADFWFEHIHNDPRLKAMIDNEALPQAIRDEALRRYTDATFKRVTQNAPDNATAVCVCYIQLPGGGHLISGCKWAGGGTSVRQARAGGTSAPNPIAENNPELSVESMSARRAARQIISHVSDARAPNFDEMESALSKLSEEVQPALELAEANRVEAPQAPPKALASGGYDVGEIAVPSERGVVEPARNLSVAQPMSLSDPYGEIDAPVPRKTPSPELFDEAPADSSRTMEEIEALDDGPVVYPEPVQCKHCGRRCVKSNDHSPDCSAFLD